MVYDFILFENAYSVENHYKDLGILAILLKKAGYKVAIANVFKENELCIPEGIPHIDFKKQAPSFFRTSSDKSLANNPLKTLFIRIVEDRYISYVLKECAKISNNIYLGSLTLGVPTFFLSQLNKHITYYFWGLRSITPIRWKTSRMGYYSLISKRLYKAITKNNNVRIIVSNEIIRDEFAENVGVPLERLVLRPERIISNLPIIVPSAKGKLNILSIGTLRPFKRIELCLNALRILSNPKINYTIAGRCRDGSGYDKLIEQKMLGLSNVKRIDRYISEEEYEELMNGCDCLVICDEPQESCPSNGTMLEALLHGKPIIAPDFDPFKYEIDKYGIGVIYKEGDVDSLCRAIYFLLEEGTESFKKNLYKYGKAHLIDTVASKIKDQIGNDKSN